MVVTGELKELVTMDEGKLVARWDWKLEAMEVYVDAIEGEGKELCTGELYDDDTGDEE